MGSCEWVELKSDRQVPFRRSQTRKFSLPSEPPRYVFFGYGLVSYKHPPTYQYQRIASDEARSKNV